MAWAAHRLLGSAYDITVDGPRRRHNDIRGNYDKVIRGLSRLAEETPQSVICVFMTSCQADESEL
jgi:sulfatase maturation enzyme AslB (radical SAM superfamily)